MPSVHVGQPSPFNARHAGLGRAHHRREAAWWAESQSVRARGRELQTRSVRATGVAFISSGLNYVVHANKEVIVSAGWVRYAFSFPRSQRLTRASPRVY